MTRVGALTVAAIVLLGLGAGERGSGSSPGHRTEVVVLLASPPLAYAPGSGREIAVEQRAFRRELGELLPEARIGWRYRLVANGFSVSLPAAEVPRLRTVSGVREVLPSASYGPQLDRTPGQIGAPALWGAALGSAGQGVKIGIIDSGIDPSHPFFDPSGYTMPPGFPKGQRRFTTAKVIVARVFPPAGARAPSVRRAFDRRDSSHGTHVAGIAAGNPNTQARGRVVSGVAPRAYLGNYKVFVQTDSGISPNANSPAIVAAVEAAVADGMDVVNFSGGEPEIEPSRDIVARALDAAAAAGVVPVIAAGNDFNDVGAGSVSSPGNSPGAITVGAVELAGTPPRSELAEFSSVGPTAISLRLKPDVAAPGVDVFSSVPSGWATLSGTSMASPHVAGAAALLRQGHPGWTAAQIKSALVQTAADVSGDDGSLSPQYQGGGLVALQRADHPLLFATPSVVSFGLLARGSTARGSIRLEDAGDGAGTWQVAEARASSASGRATLSLPPTVDVPGSLEYALVAPANARPGDVAGFVELRRGTDMRRVPFWGRVTAAALGRHRTRELARPGVYVGSTRGRPALVSRYRYPEDPAGVGVTTTLRGPELVYRFRLRLAVANFGAVITERAAGSRVEPRVVAGLDENRLTGYAGLPFHENPYLEGFHRPLLAAGALSPLPGEYALVFDSATRGGAGRFTFRFWVNDVTPPRLRVRARVLEAGRPLLVGAADSGSGVYPDSIRVRVDGGFAGHTFRRGVIRISTRGLSPGRHRLELRVSDYQETKNTENVRRILPNTRTLSTVFTVRD